MDRLILQKAAAYCAYQERSHGEVRQRLNKWEIWGEAADEIIAELVVLNYLNEERYAKTYAGGKFRLKHWGRRKISQELQRRGVSAYSIAQGMNEIDDENYKMGLQELLLKKEKMLIQRESDRFILKQKLVRFAISKGYESELVWKEVTNLMPD